MPARFSGRTGTNCAKLKLENFVKGVLADRRGRVLSLTAETFRVNCDIEEEFTEQLSEAEVSQLVDEAIAELGSDKSAMGRIIAQVRDKSAGAADGAVIARLVKERLQ